MDIPTTPALHYNSLINNKSPVMATGLHYISLSEYYVNDLSPINDSVLILMTSPQHNGLNIFGYHNTTTVSLIILAWFLLISVFLVCCCLQCFNGGFWRYTTQQRCLQLCSKHSDVLDDNNSRVSDISFVDFYADRSNRSPDPVEICRSYPPNYEVESLPSYTIVSGLPTYDDALEEFRKAGIILTPQIPVIKIFEAKDGKNKDLYGIDNNLGDSNTCTCASNNANNLLAPPITPPPPPPPPLPTNTTNTNAQQLIELTPEQLAQLSQKRLSLQIAFGSQMQRNSRSRHDMRNQLLRSRAYSNNITVTDSTAGAPVHRPRSSASFSSSTSNNEC